MSTKKPSTKNTLPTVVLVGRINVGKSSLFNRLTETGKALISPVPGTTRDYNMSIVNWRKSSFHLVDTGGVNVDTLKAGIQLLLPSKKRDKILRQASDIDAAIVRQTKEAIQKADALIMVVDAKTGLSPEDKDLALVLKKLNLPIFLVCNKVDSPSHRNNIHDFSKLGLGEVFPVSAANGSGTGDFLDVLTKNIAEADFDSSATEGKKKIRLALIGKPNVGKSSLVNKILNQQRVIVSDVAQTTREPQDTDIVFGDEIITIIDTAGLRKKARIEKGLERSASKKTAGAMSSADVVLFVTEANKPLTKQDSYLVGLIRDARKGVIVIANKWDEVQDKDDKADAKFKSYYQRWFPFLSYAPLLFVSALTGRNIDSILPLVVNIYKERGKIVNQEELDALLTHVVHRHHPAKAKGPYRPKLMKLEQTKSNPPMFTLTVGAEQNVHFSYIRFLENQIREKFGFDGIPINIHVAQRKKPQK
jgi:GTP-binding protein